MKTFNEWVIETHPDFQEGWQDWGRNLALAGGLAAGSMGLLGQPQVMAARPTSTIQAKIYDQAKVNKVEEKNNQLEVTITMVYSQTKETFGGKGYHVNIAREKALEAAASNLGVKENDLVLKGADKPVMNKDKTITYKFYIAGAE